jgi:hypothetical protein
MVDTVGLKTMAESTSLVNAREAQKRRIGGAAHP